MVYFLRYSFNWEISVAWVRTLHEQNLKWNIFHGYVGGDPTILYNTTGYGLNGLFFEIQTETRLTINFNWEISVAWVRTLHEQNLVGKKGLDFSPEIVRSGCHKLMQYNRVGRLGLSYKESAKWNISH